MYQKYHIFIGAKTRSTGQKCGECETVEEPLTVKYASIAKINHAMMGLEDWSSHALQENVQDWENKNQVSQQNYNINLIFFASQHDTAQQLQHS